MHDNEEINTQIDFCFNVGSEVIEIGMTASGFFLPNGGIILRIAEELTLKLIEKGLIGILKTLADSVRPTITFTKQIFSKYISRLVGLTDNEENEDKVIKIFFLYI